MYKFVPMVIVVHLYIVQESVNFDWYGDLQTRLVVQIASFKKQT